MKKTITIILCIVLCLGLAVPALGSNSLGVTFTAALDTDTLNVSDSAQTVTLSVTGSPAFDLDGFFYDVEYPAGWSDAANENYAAKNVVSNDAKITLDASNYNLKYAENAMRVYWDSPDSENVTGVTGLGSITFSVPANTPAGTYIFTVKSFNVSKDYATKWETNGSFTATLTINGAADTSSAELKKDGVAVTNASVGVGGEITLTPTLVNTTATISGVTWASENTSIASVDSNGKVTGVANGGPVNITAHITASDGKTYDAVCAVTVTSSPYTISIVRDGEGVVHTGEDVALKIEVSGEGTTKFTALHATVIYDSQLFTYKSASNVITGASVTDGNDGVVIFVMDQEHGGDYDTGTIATLTFTAKTPSEGKDTGTFGFTSGSKVSDSTLALSSTGPSAKVGTDVTITQQFTVKFVQQDGTTEIVTYQVDSGAKLTTVPTAPTVDYNTFTGWNNGTSTYTADEVADMTFTADTTFKASYSPRTYDVTLGEGLTADTDDSGNPKQATYGTDYVVTVVEYDPESFEYAVTYTAADGTKQNATDNGNGKFTIPGGNITGALNITLSKVSLVTITVNVYPDYVSGYTLITVESNGQAYKYDGNAMYYLDGRNVCAWLAEGPVDKTTAESKIVVGDAHFGTITFTTNDLNGDGLVDIDDAVIVNSVANKRYDVSKYMNIYLRADVKADNSVDFADVNYIISDTNYVK